MAASAVTLGNSRSKCSSYCREWTALFQPPDANANLLTHLKNLCLSGRLESCHFRSVCWKIFLGCILRNKMTWSENTRLSRKSYERLRDKHITEFHRRGIAIDANHPLCMAENDDEHRYLKDAELWTMIKLDVHRTSPGVAFFQSDKIQAVMIEILFIFGLEYENIYYKQGMHEILGPLLFVLCSDQHARNHAFEQGDTNCCEMHKAEYRDIISTVIDENYLKHDAYQMFTVIMLIIQDWYCDSASGRPVQIVQCKKMAPSELDPLFLAETERRDIIEARNRMRESNTSILKKLNYLVSCLLNKIDPMLHKQLELLDIPPTTYGLRMLRLLFAREFPISDLLSVWDAIFIFGPPFALVDTIFIALLYFIRDRLLTDSSNDRLLMDYPAVDDVHALLAFALHLFDPNMYAKPRHPAFVNFVLPQHPGANVNSKPTPRHLKSAGGSARDLTLPTTTSQIPGWMDLLFKRSPTSDKPRTGGVQFSTEAFSNSTGMTRHSSFKQADCSGFSHAKTQYFVEEEVDLLKEQCSCLQHRLSEVEGDSKQAASKLLCLFDEISQRLNELAVENDEGLANLLAQARSLCLALQNGVVECVSLSPIVGQQQHQCASSSVHRNMVSTSADRHGGPVEIAKEATATSNTEQ